MISQLYGCKMGQGEWVWLHFVGVLTWGHTLVITGVTPTSGCPNFQFWDYDGEDSEKPDLPCLCFDAIPQQDFIPIFFSISVQV